jgi:hypothetical protein
MTLDWHHLWRIVARFDYLATFAMGGLVVTVRRYWQKLREDRAASWPSADAVIQSVIVLPHDGHDVQISYRYYAMQEYRYGKYSRHFRSKTPAEQFADAIRGRSLQIRYDETNPEVSVLMERDLELVGALQGQSAERFFRKARTKGEAGL